MPDDSDYRRTPNWARQARLAGAVVLTLAAFPARAEIATQTAPLDRSQLDRFLPGARPAAAPITDGVPFLIRFTGAASGLTPGAAVEISGIRIGEVRSVGLDYAADRNGFVVPVVIVVQPSLFPAIGPRPRSEADTYEAAAALVARGLRAQIGGTQLFGGETIVTLDIVPGAAQAGLGRGGTIPELPTGPNRADRIAEQLQPLLEKIANAPVEQIFSDMQASMAALKELTSGPELRDMLVDLRQTSAELRGMAKLLGVKSTVLMDNLGETLRSTNRLVGDRSPLLADIRGVLNELNGTARSVRLLTEYLERNPNALLLGKSDNRR